MLYFDHNATSPLHPTARQAWLDTCEKLIGNPSSPHRVGARADAAFDLPAGFAYHEPNNNTESPYGRQTC